MRVLLSIISLGFFVNAFSQTGRQLYYRFRHLDQSEGLLKNWVTSVVQDDRGFFWITTFYDGLQRFDGVRFLDYTQIIKKYEPNALVMNVSKSENHQLKVRTTKNEFVFDVYRKRLVKYIPGRNKLPRKTFIDSENNVWEINDNYLLRYKERSDTIDFKQRIFKKLQGENSYLVYDTVNNQYWFANEKKLYVLDVSSGRVFNSVSDDNIPFFRYLRKTGNPAYSTLLLDNEQNLWIGTWGRTFFRYNLNSGKTTSYFLSNFSKTVNSFRPSHVSLFFLDNYNQIWAGTYGSGLLKYDKKKDAFDYILADKNNASAVRYNFEITNLFQDNQDNIWVSTDRGISIFNPYKEYFKIVTHDNWNLHSLPDHEIEPLLQVRNKDIWVGTWGGGITIFDSSFNFKSQYRFPDKIGNLVWGFVEDDKGRIWVASQYGLIHRFNPATGNFDSTFYIGKERITIKRILKDRKGNIFFGLNNGRVTKWSVSENKFIEYNRGVPVSVNPLPVLNLFFDEKENIWMSNMTGIYRLDTSKMIYTDSFFLAPKDIFNITGLTGSPYNRNFILLSCNRGGGGYFSGRTKEFKRWQPDSDFAELKISSLKKDKYGNIWFTSGLGLYYFRPADTNKIIRYPIQKGLINSAFKATPIVELKDGRWCAITSTEIVVFDPGILLQSQKDNRPALITGFKVFNERLPIDTFLFNGLPVKLDYKQNVITIEFAPSVYSFLTRQNYSYKLSGVDENWISSGNQMNASYANLKPGDYVFSVRTEGDEGNYPVTSFAISIAPPFWQSWWFYGLCFLFIFSVVYIAIRKRISNIRAKSEMRERVLEMEMAALRAQMNPHFIFNCINAIDSLIQNDERDKATSYLARFARLIRNVLESSKNEVVPFYKDFETVQLFIDLERFRSNYKFNYQLQADQELLNGDYKVPPMLIQPFIENAIHHGLFNKENGEKHLKVNARLDGDYIVYTITDNGVGRKRAEELNRINRPDHVSYGIQIASERVKNFNSRASAGKTEGHEPDHLRITDLTVNDQCSGTIVQLRLKINSNH